MKKNLIIGSTIMLVILLLVGYFRYAELKEYIPLKYQNTYDVYFIRSVIPIPEGDLGYKLYKKVNFFTFENIGNSYRLYTTSNSGYEVIDPHSENTVVNIHSDSGKDLFYFKPATHELFGPEEFNQLKLTCCDIHGI